MTKFAAALAATLATATPLAAQDSYNGYQTPQYTLLEKQGAIELRVYAPTLLAEVTVQADRSRALRAGFGILAGYIFGGNTSAQKVAMTSPVTQTASEKIAMTSPVAQSGAEGVWTISFMMPRDYTRDTLPTPKDDNIRFVETEPVRKLTFAFSGWATQRSLTGAENVLRAYARETGLTITGPVEYYYYDDPLTLPWKRRNEVAFPVTGS